LCPNRLAIEPELDHIALPKRISNDRHAPQGYGSRACIMPGLRNGANFTRGRTSMTSDECPELAQLKAAWVQKQDGETGLAYGEALTTRGYVGDAADVYEQLIATDYILGYYALAWLERDHGNHDRAQSLLRAYLDADRHPDEYTDHVAGVLGHWLWHFSNRTDAEPLLRREPFSFLQRAPI
jgi:hypothetical protein